MADELLLDTGALVSLIDRGQHLHQQYKKFFADWQAPVVSTEAVLTEATHLLGRVPGGREACLEFFLAGGAILVASSPSSLRRCKTLMKKYADLPMDFADATLVVLGEDLGTDLIFTTDHRDFSVYRAKGQRRFQILPPPTSGGRT